MQLTLTVPPASSVLGSTDGFARVIVLLESRRALTGQPSNWTCILGSLVSGSSLPSDFSQAGGHGGRRASGSSLGGSGLAILRVVKAHSRASVSCAGVHGAFIPTARHSAGGSEQSNWSEVTFLMT